MIKKSLLILISLFVFMSCSKPVTSPNNNEDSGSEVLPPLTEEEELIAKYGVDINQDNSVIKQQIKEKLQAYFQEKGSYRIILTGTPKVGEYDYSYNITLSAIIEDSAKELYLKNSTIDIDIRNVNFINGAIPKEMFSIYSFDKRPIFNYIFPEDKITTIEADAFYMNSHIREVVIPDSVTTISYAFDECFELEKLTLGKGLKIVRGFASCIKLREIDTSRCSSLESIDGSAFNGTAITEFAIPASVMSVNGRAFGSCPDLTTIIYYGDSQIR